MKEYERHRPEESRCLQILVLPAHPLTLEFPQLEHEVEAIKAGLHARHPGDRIQVLPRWMVSLSELRQALQADPPLILHFCGSGAEAHGLAFEGAAESEQLLTDETLLSVFAEFADSIHCVVLNRCYTRTQARAIAHHIRFVIGIHEATDLATASEFVRMFYQTVADGQSFKFAYREAYRAIASNVSPYLLPVLIQRTAHIYISYLNREPDRAIAHAIAQALVTHGYQPVLAQKEPSPQPPDSAQMLAQPRWDYCLFLISDMAAQHPSVWDELRTVAGLAATAPASRTPEIYAIAIQPLAEADLSPPLQDVLRGASRRDWHSDLDTSSFIQELLYVLSEGIE